MRIVQCVHCGAQNRVANYSLNRTAVCGKCHMQLPEPPFMRTARLAVKYKYWIILGVIIGGAALMDEFRSPVKSLPAGSRTNYQGYSPPSIASVNYPTVPVSQGVHQLFTNAEQIAPFRIVTPSGAESYYVKLTNAFTGALVMTFFVYGGQSFETEVPLGTYRVKYAIGSIWYGEDHLFGPDTHYSETDKTFEFSVQGNQINGYTVELIRQRGGNLHTRSISANQF